MHEDSELPDRHEVHLLTLDINGVLCDRRIKRIPGVLPAAVVAGRPTYVRPHAASFVRWALDKGWRVGIWTSATRPNAIRLVGAILRDEDIDRLAFLWSQEECVMTHRENGRPKFRKEVSRLAALPGVTLSRIIVVDDEEEKLQSANGLHPPRFDAEKNPDDDELAEGSHVRTVLERAFAADDCRSVLNEQKRV